jgi:hypothetical protein
VSREVWGEITPTCTRPHYPELPADAIAIVRPGDRLLIVWPDGWPPNNELVADLRKLLGVPLVVLGGGVRVAVIQGDEVEETAP